MKIILNFPDSKVDFMMELLSSLSFVKTKPMLVGNANEKALFLAEWDEAVEGSNDMLVDRTQARKT